MKKYLLLFYLSLTIAVTSSKAQKKTYYPQPAHPSWFKAIPLIDNTTPEWAKVMYEEDSNYVKVDSLKRIYDKNNIFQKSIHTQNYKYWLRIVQDNLTDAGKVSMPSPGEKFRTYEKKKLKNKKTNNRQSTNTWQNIGPEKTYISDGSLNLRPTQANVYCLGVSPSNTNIIYAGMETGGIFKSTDKGLSWLPVSYDYAIGSIQDIKVDPNNSDIVYISRGAEVYKTTDGGTIWSLIHTATDVVEQFWINTANTNIIFAATKNGLYKTTDAGTTWTLNFAGQIYDIESKPGSNDILYISKLNPTEIRPEIFKSTNAGNTWTLMDVGFYKPSNLSQASVNGCKIGVTPADPNRIYAGIVASGKTGDNGWIGIYYSLDEGATWQEDSGFDGAPYATGNNVNTNWYVAGYSNGYHQGFYNFDIDVSHSNADRLWIGTIWFCESGNKGGSIEYIRGTRSLEMHADIQDIDVVGSDIWIASDGGINYSNDECQTTEVRMNGITASDFWGFGQGWNDDIWVGGRYHNGNAAFHENYGIGNSVFLGGAEAPTGYVNQLENRKTYFSDIGDKRISTSLTDPPQGIANLGMYPTQAYFHFSYSEVEWDPRYANHVYVGKDNMLYKSIDGGVNFDSIYTFPGDIRRYEISRDNPDYIYAIVYHSYWDWQIHLSTDAGQSFTPISKPSYNGGSWRNLSFTLNPFDKDEIWLASNSSSNGNKIYSSIDAGNTWTNRYTTELVDQKIKDMIYQASDGGDKIYIMTNDNFYYYDTTLGEYVSYNQGLPLEHKGFMILPFYRDNKIRMASAKGIWEIPFDADTKIKAQALISQDTLFCKRDTVFLDSYSIGEANNMTYQWTFSNPPLWIEDATMRNPKVVFGSDGDFEATLQITKNGNTYSSPPVTITIQNNCESDFVPGKSLTTDTNGEYLLVSEANLNNITHFSITGWWKPNGAQEGFSALVSSGDWCAHCDYTEGLIYDYFGTRVWYKWPGNVGSWGTNSGMVIPQDEWSYVALVIEPHQATMYLNEEKYVHNISLNPGDITDLYVGYGHYNKSFKGDIDEVTIWTKALSQDEVRLMKHLTKENEIANDPDLIAYYQFNETVGGSLIMDNAGVLHGNLNAGTQLSPSQVPIGEGVSNKQNVSTGGTYDFVDTGVSITFPSSGAYPDGELVVSRINIQPDVVPNNNTEIIDYWVINNYGANQTFSPLDGITFSNVPASNNSTNVADFKLYTRLQHAFQSPWTYVGDANMIDSNAQALSFTSNVNITSFGQFVIDIPESTQWVWTGMVDNNWHNPANWAGGQLPSSSSNVLIPSGTPFHPIVNSDVIIRLICVQEGAVFMVNTGVNFEATN